MSSYCLRGERDRDLERDLERLLLLLFLPSFTSFLKLEDKRASAADSGALAGAQLRGSYPLCGLLLICVRVSGSFFAALAVGGLGDFSSTLTTLGEHGLEAGEKPPTASAGVPSGLKPLAFSLASARNTFLRSTSFSSWS